MKKSVWAFMVLFGCGMIHYTSSILNDDVKNDILHQQNTLRRSFANGLNGGPSVANMAKLSWSTHLETVAQETLEVKCSLERSPLTNSLSQISRNSNVKINSNGNFTGDILSWFEEIQTTLFFPELFACWPYNRCLQAYKLLDASHKNTGCAFKRNCRDNVSVFLCLYDKDLSNPPYNFFSPGPLCTKCDNEQSFCDNGLCVHCNPDVSICDCRKTCQKPGVGNGTLNVNTCVCSCVFGLGPNCDEPCRNPENFVDYDICSTVRREECEDPYLAEMLAYHCPEQCVCGRGSLAMPRIGKVFTQIHTKADGYRCNVIVFTVIMLIYLKETSAVCSPRYTSMIVHFEDCIPTRVLSRTCYGQCPRNLHNNSSECCLPSETIPRLVRLYCPSSDGRRGFVETFHYVSVPRGCQCELCTSND